MRNSSPRQRDFAFSGLGIGTAFRIVLSVAVALGLLACLDACSSGGHGHKPPKPGTSTSTTPTGTSTSTATGTGGTGIGTGTSPYTGTGELPGVPTNPNPPDNATGVPADTDLSWEGGERADRFYVHLGTEPDPPYFSPAGGKILHDWEIEPPLRKSRTYYWRVIASNQFGNTSGPVWSFATEEGVVMEWEQKFPEHSPASTMQLSGAGMAWDGEKIILFGGGTYGVSVSGKYIIHGMSPYPHTWTWDGSDWTELEPPAQPANRYDPAMCNDGQSALLYGGYPVIDSFEFGNDTFRFDGTTWAHVTSDMPPGRARTDMTLDRNTNQVILFGGLSGWDPHNEAYFTDNTYAFSGSSWSEMSISAPPSARHSHCLGFDGTGVVLFSGWGVEMQADTWRLEDSDWVKLEPDNSPDPRYGHAMATITDNDSCIMFGGGLFDLPTDTWLWDGEDWKEIVSTENPPGRYYHAMAYDPERHEVVLYGGYLGDGSTNLSDTWVLKVE